MFLQRIRSSRDGEPCPRTAYTYDFMKGLEAHTLLLIRSDALAPTSP